MKTTTIIILMILFTSCARKYGLDLAIKHSGYDSNSENIDFDGNNFSLFQYDSKGFGGELAISEEFESFIGKFSYFYNTLDDADIGSVGAKLVNYKQSGFKFTFGLKIKYVQPFIGFINQKSSFQTQQANVESIDLKNDVNMFGYGVRVEIPYGDDSYYGSSNKFFYISYAQYESSDVEIFNSETIKKTDILIGFRWNFYTFMGPVDW